MAVPIQSVPFEPVDESARGLLLDIDRFAAHDGPGIRTAVFLKGCPLSCAWCHSPESRGSRPEILYQEERCTGCWLCLDACPNDAISMGGDDENAFAELDRSQCEACGACVDVCYPGALRLAGGDVSAGELASDIARDLPFFQSSGGGVTLSGGEPARQFDFSYNFLLACQNRGIHTAIETTGYARGAVIDALASVADLVLYDVKFLDDAMHRRYTGVPNRIILENLSRLAGWHDDVQVRVPCIPGINDGIEQIRATARFVVSVGLRRIALLPYNGAAGAKYAWLGAPFPIEEREPQSEAAMEALAEICRVEGLEVQIGG